MTDRFDNRRPELEAPLTRSEAADLSGSDHEFTNVARAILVTSAGDLTIRLRDDAADLTLSVTAGTFLPLRVSHVRQASTASVIGFW